MICCCDISSGLNHYLDSTSLQPSHSYSIAVRWSHRSNPLKQKHHICTEYGLPSSSKKLLITNLSDVVVTSGAFKVPKLYTAATSNSIPKPCDGFESYMVLFIISVSPTVSVRYDVIAAIDFVCVENMITSLVILDRL